MGNTYYQSGSDRSKRVGDLFARVARRYDLLNDLQSLGWHRRWKRRLVSMTEPQRGERALDLCCGTGDIARLLSRKGIEVVGLDFSEPMLRRAVSRAEEAGDRVAFCRGDAQALPFATATFDIVTIGYGLRNLADWEGGLAEMWRVLRPGGRLVVLEFGKPTNPLWRALYYGYLRWGVPILGRLFCGDAAAYGYILESLRQYPAQTGVREKLESLGGEPVRLINLLGGAMSLHYARKPR